MMIKRAYSVQMSFDIPDEQKNIALQAKRAFEEVISRLRIAKRYLNKIYEPFSDLKESDPDEIYQHRLVFRRYRNQVKEYYQEVLAQIQKATLLMTSFSSDLDVVEMLDSFANIVHYLKDDVNTLLGDFSQLRNPKFPELLTKDIDQIKEDTDEIKEILNDRVLEYLDTNILAKNWISGITNEESTKLFENSPLIVELFKERQKVLGK